MTTLQTKIYFSLLALYLHALLLLFPQSGMSHHPHTFILLSSDFLSVLQGQEFFLQFSQPEMNFSLLLTQIGYFIIWLRYGESIQRHQYLICDSMDDIKMGVLCYIVTRVQKIVGKFYSEYVYLKVCIVVFNLLYINKIWQKT